MNAHNVQTTAPNWIVLFCVCYYQNKIYTKEKFKNIYRLANKNIPVKSSPSNRFKYIFKITKAKSYSSLERREKYVGGYVYSEI